jgi:hypothetical protein
MHGEYGEVNVEFVAKPVDFDALKARLLQLPNATE